jgi:hypothetical protein
VIVVGDMPLHALTSVHSGPTHGGLPHWFGVVTPQTCPLEQLPQLAVTPPQPSAMTPQWAPA